MREAEAWRVAARRLATGRWNHLGICAEVPGDKLDEATKDAMHDRIQEHAALSSDRDRVTDAGEWFAYPRGTEREARIYAALWLALEAEDDARRMRRGG